jgi:hypothetical protein
VILPIFRFIKPPTSKVSEYYMTIQTMMFACNFNKFQIKQNESTAMQCIAASL